jgi:hypothetical protein
MKKRIFIVDDSQPWRLLFQHLLKEEAEGNGTVERGENGIACFYHPESGV